MENKNELINVNNEQIGDIVTQETDDFVIYKQPNGKFRKEMKYKKYFSHIPETDDEMKELFKIFNSQDDKLVTRMSSIVDEKIQIHQVFTNPYQSFDEKTGGNINGVTTTIFDGKRYIATSSKAVYYTIFNLFDVFGYPNDENYNPIEVVVTGTRMQNGIQINLEIA